MDKLRGLYKQLYNDVHDSKKEFVETEFSNFVTMRGNRYDQKPKDGKAVRFMVVGRAVNGWGASRKSDAESYADEAIELFINKDRYKDEWDMKTEKTDPYSKYKKKDKDGKEIECEYHLLDSPFWNTAIGIYNKLHNREYYAVKDVYEDFVWSNIYKIAPKEEGNPSTNLIYAQAKTCVEILKEEIRLLEPTHLLLVIDKSWVSWSSRNKVMFDFMEAFDDYECHCKTVLKNKDIVQCAFTAGGCKVLITRRPETLGRKDYIDAVKSVFDSFPIK